MTPIQLQTTIQQWALNRDFDASYGVLVGEQKTSKNTFLSVSFGYSNISQLFGEKYPVDIIVEIYNSNYIILRTSQRGSQTAETFRNHEELFFELEKLCRNMYLKQSFCIE